MSAPTRLTDRTALKAHRRRAARDPALFLHEAARDEMQDRLAFIKKSFTKPAIVTGFPDFWSGVIPDAIVTGDSETLDLAPAAHDLVIHAMALHWADDPVGQLIQARRALVPDGFFMAAFFGGTTLHELRSSLADAEVALTGGLSPRIAPMGEIRDLGALLQRAGFALPVADSVPLTVSYPSPRHLMHDLRAMGETNALAARHRAPAARALFDRASETYVSTFGDASGRAPATFELIFLAGWSPHADQPQPLRPGSARARLSDALGTREHPVKD
ncbi:methyltransferase domain-containing protein [Roseovarius salinarum]|uniref:methyltransferase domain-containing protein n=1 Tax=Roseovarius salinarum TaxID=1981892 RepID=UPI000C33DB00|nr:methyltransferase domain-containing protein [Roseovarius salinarum]